MIRPLAILLTLGACQAVPPPVGPASLQIVPPNYYSRSLKFHGGSGVQRGDASQPRRSRDGAVTIIAPFEAASEAPEGGVGDSLIEQLARIQEELKKLRERIDWEQNSGAWRAIPSERQGK